MMYDALDFKVTLGLSDVTDKFREEHHDKIDRLKRVIATVELL